MALTDSVLAVFRDVFDDTELEISEKTDASHIADWDSNNHINLIVALEEEFDVSFTTKEIGEMTCVGDLYTLLNAKGIQ